MTPPFDQSDQSDYTRQLDRSQGVLYGQIIGDSLGSLVEFQTAEEIATAYPDGVRELADGGCFNLSAGQATDDSEMAVVLARSLLRCGGFDAADVAESYRRWARSEPFDIGITCADALLRGVFNPDSQANGALMRVSPIGVAFAGNPDAARNAAAHDATLTHVHPRCVSINQRFAAAIAQAVGERLDKTDVLAMFDPGDIVAPPDYQTHMGWVIIAFRNALYQLATAPSFEEALVRTIARGGDTDTNAAICGALYGAVCGASGIPDRWKTVVDTCRPDAGSLRPRPQEYWAHDVADLGAQLLAIASTPNVT